MAELQLAGGDLVLHLSVAEKAEAVHGEVMADPEGNEFDIDVVPPS